MATSLSEQTKDLSSCCVCYDTFNDKKLKPKYLSCSHTFCLKCIKLNLRGESVKYFKYLFFNVNSFNCRKWQTDHRRAKSLAHFVTRCARYQLKDQTVCQTTCTPFVWLSWRKFSLNVTVPSTSSTTFSRIDSMFCCCRIFSYIFMNIMIFK